MKHSSFSVSSTLRRPSRAFAWLMLALGLSACVLFGWGLRNALLYTFAGQSATGRVIEFHKTGVGSRSASVVGEVEVVLPGKVSFRTEVDDALGLQDWAIGGDIPVRCAELHAGYPSCSADPGLVRLLFPVLFVSIGAGMAIWSINRIRSR